MINGNLLQFKATRDNRDCCRELSVEMEQKVRNRKNQKVTIKTDYFTCRWSNETHLKEWSFNVGSNLLNSLKFRAPIRSKDMIVETYTFFNRRV